MKNPQFPTAAQSPSPTISAQSTVCAFAPMPHFFPCFCWLCCVSFQPAAILPTHSIVSPLFPLLCSGGCLFVGRSSWPAGSSRKKCGHHFTAVAGLAGIAGALEIIAGRIEFYVFSPPIVPFAQPVVNNEWNCTRSKICKN